MKWVNLQKIPMLNILCCFVLLLHFLQIFTPETGFDALWYHLPVAHAIVQHGGLVYIPELYQSVNPLFSDLFFAVGYAFDGAFGTKVVAYLFMLATVGVSYLLARKVLKPEYVGWAVICVSLIHTIAWQSASFYVDVAKALWELLALYVLVKAIDSKKISRKTAWVVGLLVGASVGTKAFSILLVPFFAGILWIYQDKLKSWQNIFLFICGIAFIAGPFYLHTYIHTGNPFYTLTQHIGKLHEIGGTDSLWRYLLIRIAMLPYSPLALLTARDYVSPVLIACLPVLIAFRKQLLSSHVLTLLTTFAAYQWLIWWFIPPTSTRYALSGFVILIILIIWGLEQLQHTMPDKQRHVIRWILTLAVVTALIPRLIVAMRSIYYLSGKQTQEGYLQQFRDGNIDQHMDRWYELSN